MATNNHHARRLLWEGCCNVRDLGGLRTKDGRETRWGAVVRADDLAQLTPAGRAALVDHGVRSIVDLRRPGEAEVAPNPFREPGYHGVRYHNLSFVDPTAPPVPVHIPLVEDYKFMLDRYGRQVATIMRAIGTAPEGGVLIHCVAGKDRTGIISGLLLDLAGVPRDEIALDYALTAEYRKPQLDQWLAEAVDAAERNRRQVEIDLFTPHAEIMVGTLAHLDERYDGPAEYLRVIGLQVGEIEALRAKLHG